MTSVPHPISAESIHNSAGCVGQCETNARVGLAGKFWGGRHRQPSTVHHARCAARWTLGSSPFLRTGSVHRPRPVHLSLGAQIYSAQTLNCQSFASSADKHVAVNILWLYLPCATTLQKLTKELAFATFLNLLQQYFKLGFWSRRLDSLPGEFRAEVLKPKKNSSVKRGLARQETRSAVYRPDTRRAAFPLPVLCCKLEVDFAVGRGVPPCIAPIHGRPFFRHQNCVAGNGTTWLLLEAFRRVSR